MANAVTLSRQIKGMGGEHMGTPKPRAAEARPQGLSPAEDADAEP